MKQFKIILFISIFSLLAGCKKFLDVVPDNVATIDNAFTQRSSAEKYLFTCFSYMPRHGDLNGSTIQNPGFVCADEMWFFYPSRDIATDLWNVARGQQNSTDPLGDFWTGDNAGSRLYQGLRDCNIFLENIHKVPDMDQQEKERWIREVKFLKAYYHFYLLRMYGPIPLIKTNLPISSTSSQVQVYRQPVDSCFNYVVQLLNEAMQDSVLPARIIGNEASELGRPTGAMVLSLKAKVLVEAASPLWNGNTDYAGLRDDQGTVLFNPTYDADKWVKAAAACKDAIDYCQANGYALYYWPPTTGVGWIVNDTIKTELNIRTAVTEKNFNTEIIWANTKSKAADIQRWAMPLIAAGTSGSGPKGMIAPPIKMAELFYTNHGVPINEDISWDFAGRYNLKTAGTADRYYIKQGEQTVKLHFDREPRFYANLTFDRAIWFGNWVGNFNKDNLFFLKARKGEAAARQGISNFSATGYWIKKLVSMGTTAASDGNVTGSNMTTYPWPEMRLADLYLLYAEALNESEGPGPNAYQWINLVRARAGLQSVQTSWSTWSSDNTKHTTKTGLREIIHQERMIELAFEGHRFWDLRRWKMAIQVLNAPIKGWDIDQVDVAPYNKEIILFNQAFSQRDYLWPIEIAELQANPKLVQNPGW